MEVSKFFTYFYNLYTLILRRVYVQGCMVRIKLSSRIGAVIENNAWRGCIYTWCINDRLVSSTSSWSGLACATCRRCRRVDIGKAFAWILGDSRRWQRITFLTPEHRVKIRDKDAWRHTARPHARRFFVERLCKYYRRRKPNSTQTESFRVRAKQNRFHGWIGYLAKRFTSPLPVDTDVTG